MKTKMIAWILAILCLSMIACQSSETIKPNDPGIIVIEPTPTPEPDLDSAIEFDLAGEIDPDTLYTISVPVYCVKQDGFIGPMGESYVYIRDTKNTDTFRIYNQVKVFFYGKDFSMLENPVEFTFDDGCRHNYAYLISETVQMTPIISSTSIIDYPECRKPILYFYPETETVISAKLELDGRLTCTYPEHGEDGWQNFLAKPDGTLIAPDGKEYYALYWEGETSTPFDLSKGFCVEGSRTAEFLADILPKLGLSAREANEFIIYWLPLMQDNPYNLISFQHEAYTDSAKLILSPEPDTLIRVFMAWKGLEMPVEIEPQTIVTPERVGFTVVEWGGAEITD